MNEPEVDRNKRPIFITLICTIDFIFLTLGICLVSSSLFREYAIKHHVPNWVAPSINLWFVAYLIVVLGLWRMKKWAAYIYILLAANTIFTSDGSTFYLSMEALSIYYISKNISKMS